MAVAMQSEAQVGIVDEGSFTITVNGQRAGREDFRIERRAGSGPDAGSLLAQATVVYSDRRLSPKLSTDSAGAPLSFQMEVRGNGGTQERWSGTISQGRVSARSSGARGETAKEYIVTDGAVVLDDDVFHQYYFIARRGTNGSVPVVVPRRNQQIALRVAQSGAERIMFGTSEISARHLVLTEPGGATRDVWVDAQNRVLKVAIPSLAMVAMRDDPPAR